MSCPQPYTWRTEPNGDRTCSHCGSLHPDDMIDIMYKYIAREPGYTFEPSDKNYKIYAHRAGVRNAGDGGIKFYGWHIPADNTEFQAAWALTAPVYRLRAEEEHEAWREKMRKRAEGLK